MQTRKRRNQSRQYHGVRIPGFIRKRMRDHLSFGVDLLEEALSSILLSALNSRDQIDKDERKSYITIVNEAIEMIYTINMLNEQLQLQSNREQ